MDAPLIIIPISSQNRVTLLADLGKLHLSNAFTKYHSSLMDSMQLDLKDLALYRAKGKEIDSLKFIFHKFCIIFAIIIVFP